MSLNRDDGIDEVQEQEKLDAEAEYLHAEQLEREKFWDAKFGVGGEEPDPDEVLYI